MYSGECPSSVLVFTLMPCCRASASTYGLNDEPTCSRFCSAMFNWQKIFLHFLAGASKLGPPYMAQISPVLGCSSTAPACAQFGMPPWISDSSCFTDAYSAFIIGLLNVVVMRSPPLAIWAGV